MMLTLAQVKELQALGRRLDCVEVTSFSDRGPLFVVSGAFRCGYCGSVAANGQCRRCGAPQNAAAAYKLASRPDGWFGPHEG